MGANETEKLLHHKGHHQSYKAGAYRMGKKSYLVTTHPPNGCYPKYIKN